MNKRANPRIVAATLAMLLAATTAAPTAFAQAATLPAADDRPVVVAPAEQQAQPQEAEEQQPGETETPVRLLAADPQSEEENQQGPVASQAEGTPQEQIDAAEAGVETRITLQSDVSGDLTIPANKNIVLNLSGFKLTNSKGHTITNNGTLTIEGTGTVDNITHGKAAVFNDVGGTVVLNGGTYTRSKENGSNKVDSGGNSYYNIQNLGEMTINDGVTVEQNGNFSSMIASGFYDGTDKTTNPKLVINGGHFDGGMNTIKNDDRGILEINGGTFTNVRQATLMNWNEATITGGSFEANGAEAVIYNGYLNDGMDCGKLTISGGAFTATGSSPVIQQNDKLGLGTVQIDGGTFKTDNGEIIGVASGTKTEVTITKGSFTTNNDAAKKALAKYVDPSAEFDVASGTVSAIPTEQAAASVGAKNYKTLAAAINAAQTGETVVLKQDVTESVSVPAGKEITLDLAGKNIQSSANAVTVSGKLTVKDSTATTEPQVNGSDVTYTSGKVSGTDAAIAALNGGEVIVESGMYESTKNIGLSAVGNITPGGNAVNSMITVKGGYVLAQEYAASAQGRGAELNIVGGVLKAKDNAVIGGNGTKDDKADRGGTTINISGGTMIGGIQSAGYIACGVYHPQEGTLNITGGKFQITNGVGLLIRAGSANITGGEIVTTGTVSGWVGDNKIDEGCHGIVYDSASNYPGAAATDKVAIGGTVKIVTEGSNAPVKMRRPESSAENKIGVTGGTFSGPVEKEYLSGLKAELKANSGDAPYSYYTDVEAAKEAAKKLGGGTVTDLNATPSTTSFTVTLKFADDVTADQTTTVAENGIMVLPTPTRAGYAFQGWTDGTNTYAGGTNYTVTKDATLTAVWRYTGGSSSGSSRSDRDNSYSISVPSRIVGGSITVTPRSAEKGNTVTITVNPNSGYVLDKLSVLDNKGDELDLSAKKNGTYTFTMPAGRVDVKASFREEKTTSFEDVASDAYYADAVQWAVEQGITSGKTATRFAPNDSCTRAQLVTFLWRAAGSPEPKSDSNPFRDVSDTDYSYKAILWAVENGITNGASADRFDPNATVTRAQAVTFLHRGAGSPDAAGSGTFADVAGGAYYAGAVAWANGSGITGGTGNGRFSPNAPCTRGQIVTFLYRADTK